MHHLGPTSRQLEDLVADGSLRIQDLGYLFVLIQNMTPTGRVLMRPAALAARIGVSRETCYAAIKRLRAQHLVARVLDPDTHGTYFLVNPFLASIGSEKRRGALWAQFRAAIETGDFD